MGYFGSSKKEAEEKLLKIVAGLTVLLAGTGVLLSLTLFYLPLGRRLFFWAVGLGAAGWLLIKVLLALGRYEEICCPSCQSLHQVSRRAGQFNCQYCGQKLFGPEFWKAGLGRRTDVWSKSALPAQKPIAEADAVRREEVQ